MSELRIIAKHASSVLVGQMAVMTFGIADTMIAARHSEASLAALAIGSAIYISVYVGLIGILQALLPLWAQHRGANTPERLGASVRQSLYLCGAASALGMAILLHPQPLMAWTDIPPALHPQVQEYLAILAMALPLALLFRLYSTLNQSLGHPLLVTWLQVGALALKVPLSIWLTLGGAGLAPMGVAGCAWATLFVQCALLACAALLLRTQDLYAPMHLWKRMEPPHWPTLRTFARMGIPAGLAVLVEVTSFTLMALFIARQGLAAAGAHQIAANVAATLYMVPLSLSIATSARVSYWLGRHHPVQARHAAACGLATSVGCSMALASALYVARDTLAQLYSQHPAISAVASGLLLWVALYHLADAIQTVCVFLLRCYHVTLTPLVLYSITLWGLGLSGGYILAYHGIGAWHPAASPALFWAASVVALALVAGALALLLWRVTHQSVRGSPAHDLPET